jgi:hypothetical protein
MKIALAIAALTATPAIACDLDGSYAEARRTLHGAEVLLRNNLARGVLPEVQCVFSMGDGLAIQVIWNHAPGDAPDTAIIIPPPGFLAIPPEVTVPEHQSTIVLIVPEVMG